MGRRKFSTGTGHSYYERLPSGSQLWSHVHHGWDQDLSHDGYSILTNPNKRLFTTWPILFFTIVKPQSIKAASMLIMNHYTHCRPRSKRKCGCTIIRMALFPTPEPTDFGDLSKEDRSLIISSRRRYFPDQISGVQTSVCQPLFWQAQAYTPIHQRNMRKGLSKWFRSFDAENCFSVLTENFYSQYSVRYVD